MKRDVGSWAMCAKCHGRGRKSKGLRKKVKLRYRQELEAFEQTNGEGIAPVRPQAHLEICPTCKGTGLIPSSLPPLPDTENYPHVAIIGGGIGGVALAVACLHRGIPFTLYERDSGFDARAQGYGLTLQQASRAIEGFGIMSMAKSLVSTRHVVHTTHGKVVGEWGIRKWGAGEKTAPKRTNIHIARQALRLELLDQLGGHAKVQWHHQLIDFKECAEQGGEKNGVDLSFQVDGVIKTAHADVVVGSDGIRSSVRKLLMPDDASALRYLGCIVILGICPLSDIVCEDRTLLDSATVFQTANGVERMYMMPFDDETVMWQLSFPMDEDAAKTLSKQGTQALKEEALRRCPWHDPIPQILQGTKEALISGYPAYDRETLSAERLQSSAKATLIGDAAHPMSPFKGQGANQALLDALALARSIALNCRPLSHWREKGIRASVLTEFEAEMLQRSAKKVKESADAAEFLHTEAALHEGNEPRGRHLK